MLDQKEWDKLMSGRPQTPATPPSQTNKPPKAPQATSPQPQEKGILGTGLDIIKGGLAGAFKEVENIAQTGHDIADYVDNKFSSGTAIDDDTDYDFVPDIIKPETGIGKTAQSISAFATGWFMGGKLITAAGKTALAGTKSATAIQQIALKAPKASKAVKTAAKGGVIDFITGDSSDERLADTLVDNDIFSNAFTEYLAGDEDDSALEGRFKNVLEGFLVGEATDTAVLAFKGLKKGYKASLKGSLEGSLAAKKEASEILETATKETAPKTAAKETAPKTAAKETIKENAKETPQQITTLEQAQKLPNWAKVKDLTPQAKAKQIKKEIKEKHKALNTEHYREASKTFLDGFQDPLHTATAGAHISMETYDNKALDYIFGNKLDETFDPDKLLLSKGLKGQDPRLTISIQSKWLNLYAPDHIKKSLQDVKDDVQGSVQKARKVMEDLFDITLDLKTTSMEAAQTVKLMDLIRVRPGGEKAGVILESAGADRALGKALLSEKTDQEILETALTVSSLIENGNTKELLNMAAGMTKNPKEAALILGINPEHLWDTAMTLRYCSMLSSPKTHIRNLVGNSAKLPLVAFEETIQGMAKGVMAAKQEGKSRLIGGLKGAKTGAYYLQGLYYGFGQAKDTFFNAIKYAEPITRVSEYNQGAKITSNQGALRLPLRLLGAADEFFASWAGTAKAYEEAVLELKASGILQNTAPELREQLTKKWLDDSITNSFVSVTMKNGDVIEKGAIASKSALDIADEATFQQKLDATNQAINNVIQKNPALKLLFPFYKTPTNIFKDAFWTRGMNAPREMAKAYNSGDPEQIAKAVSHFTSACILWTSAYNLVMSGKITGAEQGTRFQEHVKQQNGIQPNSYRDSDGNYYSLNLIEPYGSMAGFLATAVETADREGSDLFSIEMLDYVLEGLLQTAKEKTFLKGLSDIFTSMERGTTGKALTQIPISFLPGILRDMGQAIDPIKRQTPDFYTRALNRTPLRENLAPKVNWITGQLEEYNHGGGVGVFYDAASHSKEKGSAVFYELSRLGGVGDPSSTINGIELTPEQYAEYCQTIGTIQIGGVTLYQALDRIINSDVYQNDILLNPDPNPYELNPEREKRLQKVIDTYKDRGKAQYMSKLKEQLKYTEITNF